MAGDPAAQLEWIGRVLGVTAPGGSGKGDKVLFTQARLAYETARKQVSAGIDTLLTAIRKECAGEPDFAEIDAAISELGVLKDGLDDRLIDALDEGYTATTAGAEAAARGKAAKIIADYQAFYASNSRLLDGLDKNPVVPVQVESVLEKALNGLASRLG